MNTVLAAEWAPQRAVMLTWPRPDGDFGHIFESVESNFFGIARAIAEFEPLHINCEQDKETLQKRLIENGVPAERVQLYQLPNNDVWARDHGPITVFRKDKPVLLDFQFNGWGGKFEHTRDNALNTALASQGAWHAPLQSIDFVLEGGAIESDGQGTLLTTERCLLAPTRNPAMNREQVEHLLMTTFGLRRVLWLKHGDLLGDDTDGHIDTLARFCDPHSIAYQSCDDTSDPHFEALAAMRRELEAFRTPDGRPYKLIALPLPDPIYDQAGQRLPAGYANFLITNGAVLVPAYDVAQDAAALKILSESFPDRKVMAVDCRYLIHQYGSLHCVTMQLPCGP